MFCDEVFKSCQVDANFTDDVGQTLLNWSSAFGTVEMVTYLCEKGADVNKGQRSSSLHYAACFGRSDVSYFYIYRKFLFLETCKSCIFRSFFEDCENFTKVRSKS